MYASPSQAILVYGQKALSLVSFLLLYRIYCFSQTCQVLSAEPIPWRENWLPNNLYATDQHRNSSALFDPQVLYSDTQRVTRSCRIASVLAGHAKVCVFILGVGQLPSVAARPTLPPTSNNRGVSHRSVRLQLNPASARR